MYYLGNIEYFLKQKKYSDIEITELLGKFEEMKVKQEDENNIQTALVVSGAIAEVLGEPLAAEFRNKWEREIPHQDITFAKGIIPEKYLTRV